MTKLKILCATTWYAAPGGARKLDAGDIIEVSDEVLISSWVTARVAERVA